MIRTALFMTFVILYDLFIKNKFPYFANDGCFKFNTKHQEACLAYQDENQGFHSKQDQENKQTIFWGKENIPLSITCLNTLGMVAQTRRSFLYIYGTESNKAEGN